MAWTYYQKESKANVQDNFACLKIIVWKLTKLILSGRCGFAVNNARIIRVKFKLLYFEISRLTIYSYTLLAPYNRNPKHKGGAKLLTLDIKDIQDCIIEPLNEILLLAYGTEVYRQILVDIEKIIKELECQHQVDNLWQ